jgi:hypothetical protein
MGLIVFVHHENQIKSSERLKKEEVSYVLGK